MKGERFQNTKLISFLKEAIRQKHNLNEGAFFRKRIMLSLKLDNKSVQLDSLSKTIDTDYEVNFILHKSFIFKFLLAILTLALLIYWVEWKQIQASLYIADWRYVGIALALFPLNLALQAWMWQTLIQKIYPDESFIDSLGAVLCGSALGLFTPAKLGDFVGRAYYLKHDNKWQLAALMGTQQLINIGIYIGLGVLALLYFLLFHIKLAITLWYLVMILGLISVLTIITALLHPKMVYRTLLEYFPHPKVQKVFSFLEHLSLRDLYTLWGQGVFRYVVFSTQFLLLLYAFHPSISIWEAYLAVLMIFFAKTVIPAPTLAELGVRESVAIYFLGLFGVSSEIAFNASMLLTIINLFLPALLGIPFILKMRFGKQEEKKRRIIAEHTEALNGDK